MYLPGDLVFVRGSNFVADAIRWAERNPGEAESYAHHVAGFVTATEVVEAQSRVVRNSLGACVGERAHEIWRCLHLTDQQRLAVALTAESYVGRQYGYLKIVAHFTDALLSRLRGRDVYLVRRLACLDRYPICSWVWAEAYDKALGMRFGVSPSAAQPDDMHDFVSKSSDWDMVYRSGGAD